MYVYAVYWFRYDMDRSLFTDMSSYVNLLSHRSVKVAHREAIVRFLYAASEQYAALSPKDPLHAKIKHVPAIFPRASILFVDPVAFLCNWTGLVLGSPLKFIITHGISVMVSLLGFGVLLGVQMPDWTANCCKSSAMAAYAHIGSCADHTSIAYKSPDKLACNHWYWPMYLTLAIGLLGLLVALVIYVVELVLFHHRMKKLQLSVLKAVDKIVEDYPKLKPGEHLSLLVDLFMQIPSSLPT
jgi:hypothetical protein